MKLKSLAMILFAVFLQVFICKAQSFTLKDSAQVISLNKSAWDASASDPDLSLSYAKKALVLAQKINYTRGTSYSYNILGSYFKIKGNYDSALFFYRKSLVIRQKLGEQVNIARSYRNVMTIEALLGNTKQAIETGQKGLIVLDSFKTNDDALIEKAWLKVNLAPFYLELGVFDTATKLVTEGKKIFEEYDNTNGTAASFMNLGNIYAAQKLYQKALAEYQSAIPLLIAINSVQELAKAYNNAGSMHYYLKNYNQALTNYKKAYTIRVENGFEDDLQGSLLNIGIIHDAFGAKDSAIKYYTLSLDQSSRSGNSNGVYESNRALGMLFFDSHNYAKALKHLTAAKLPTINFLASPERLGLLKEIADAYKALGIKDSAFYYTDLYANYIDSLSEVLRQSIVLKAALNESKLESQINDQKGRQKSTVIIAMGVALTLLLIIFFLYYRFVRSKRNMQELREIVKDKELKALDAMLEGQHEERKRLAAELHDTIGSMLAATKLSFKAMEKSLEKMVEENRGQYGKINTMLDETMESVRRISHNMASGIFSERGLEGALADLCQTFQHPGRMHIQLSTYGLEQPLDYNTEVQLYRIVQELLTNIVKHAQATEVTIQLIKSNQNINLTVEDSGRGFNPEEATRKKGIGLSNIDLRVKKLNGSWNIDSGKGRGTTVIIDIPVKKDLA